MFNRLKAVAVEGLCGTVEGLWRTVEGLWRTVEGLCGTVKDCRGTVKDCRGTVEGLWRTVKDCRGTVEGLWRTVEGLCGTVEGLWRTVEGLCGTVKDCRGTVWDCRGTVKDCRGTVWDCRGTVKDCRGTAEGLWALWEWPQGHVAVCEGYRKSTSTAPAGESPQTPRLHWHACPCTAKERKLVFYTPVNRVSYIRLCKGKEIGILHPSQPWQLYQAEPCTAKERKLVFYTPVNRVSYIRLCKGNEIGILHPSQPWQLYQAEPCTAKERKLVFYTPVNRDSYIRLNPALQRKGNWYFTPQSTVTVISGWTLHCKGKETGILHPSQPWQLYQAEPCTAKERRLVFYTPVNRDSYIRLNPALQRKGNWYFTPQSTVTVISGWTLHCKGKETGILHPSQPWQLYLAEPCMETNVRHATVQSDG